MLLFNIVPLLGLGQMQVYTQTYLGDTKAITGTYISENQQKLGVEVVQKGTFDVYGIRLNWGVVLIPEHHHNNLATAC